LRPWGQKTKEKKPMKRHMALETLLQKFQDYIIIKNYSDRTIESYIHRVLFFFKYLKNEHKINNILLVTKDDIRQYQTYLYYYRFKDKKQLSPMSQYGFITALSSFFRFLNRHDYIPYNPMVDIEFPKYTKSLPRNILTRKEMAKVLDAPSTRTKTGLRDKAMLEVLYSTGMRTGEIINLSLYDLDLQKGLIKINKGKGRKDRIVPIGKVACKYLKKYLRKSRPRINNNSKQLLLFLTLRGNRLYHTNFAEAVRNYAKEAGIKKHITPHSFRHTCATHMLELGADIRYIQELLGHESIQTTQIYTRVTIKDLKKVHMRFHPREREN
jgi:integrase/recombinase XerD